VHLGHLGLLVASGETHRHRRGKERRSDTRKIRTIGDCYGAKRARPLNVSFLFPSLLSFLLGVERWDWEGPRLLVLLGPFRECLCLARLPVRCVLSPCWPVRSLGPLQLNALPFTFPPRLRRNFLSSPFSSRPSLPFFSFIVLYTRCAYCLSSISSILFAASGRVLDNTSASCLSFTGSCILAHSLLCLHFSAISPSFLSPGAYPLIRTA